jgi:hypothetical protein
MAGADMTVGSLKSESPALPREPEPPTYDVSLGGTIARSDIAAITAAQSPLHETATSECKHGR